MWRPTACRLPTVPLRTDTTLSEEEIIKRYGYRWNIEVCFKTCKQYLEYTMESQSTSFDSLTAHLAIANVRYMMLREFFALTDAQMAEFVQQFINNLPDYLRASLEVCAEQLSTEK